MLRGRIPAGGRGTGAGPTAGQRLRAARAKGPFMERGSQLDEAATETRPQKKRGRKRNEAAKETRPQKKRGRPSEEDLPRGSDRDQAGGEASGVGRFEETD